MPLKTLVGLITDIAASSHDIAFSRRSTPAPSATQATQAQKDPGPTAFLSSGTTYKLTAQNLGQDNSTATLIAEGNGSIDALGTFHAVSGVSWNPSLLDLGYFYQIGQHDTAGGGYAFNEL
ncbi:hypothetical protein OC861_006726, partial [Tilletia horrida]